jgi:hypothetical protein
VRSGRLVRGLDVRDGRTGDPARAPRQVDLQTRPGSVETITSS